MTPTPETVKRLCEASHDLAVCAYAILHSIRRNFELDPDHGVALMLSDRAELVCAALAAVEQEIQG